MDDMRDEKRTETTREQSAPLEQNTSNEPAKETHAPPRAFLSVAEVAIMGENAVSTIFSGETGSFGLVRVLGRYKQKPVNSYANGSYDALIDIENHDGKSRELTVVVPSSIRARLPDDKTVEMSGVLSFAKNNAGTIHFKPILNVCSAACVGEDESVGENEKKRKEAREKVLKMRSERETRDVSKTIFDRVVGGVPVKGCFIVGHSAVVDRDVLNGAGAVNSIHPFEFEFVRVSMTEPEKIAAAMTAAASSSDFVAVVRGGGDMGGVFDSPGLAKSVFDCDCPVLCALGHDVDHPFFERVADRAFSTPTELGTELLRMTERAVARRDGETEAVRTAFEKKLQSERERIESTAKENEKRLVEMFAKSEEERGRIGERLAETEKMVLETNKKLLEKTVENDAAKLHLEALLENARIDGAKISAGTSEKEKKAGERRKTFALILGVLVGSGIGFLVRPVLEKIFG